MSELDELEVVEAVREVGAVTVLAPEPAPSHALDRRAGAFGSLGAVALAPATQAVAVAAGGFIAGAAVVGLTARRRGRGSRLLARGSSPASRSRGGRSSRRGRRTSGKAGELVRIVGTRSLLVDVHLLDSVGR